MIAFEGSGPVASEIQTLRTRATRCRAYAREYSSEVGASLFEMAAELDQQADRLECAVLAAPARV